MPRAPKDTSPAQCGKCGKFLTRKADMPRHMKLHAKNLEEMMHECPEPGCDYKNIQKSNVMTHYRTHTGEKSTCPHPDCDFATADPGSLTRHRKAVHGYQPKPRNRCTLNDAETCKAKAPRRPRQKHAASPASEPEPVVAEGYVPFVDEELEQLLSMSTPSLSPSSSLSSDWDFCANELDIPKSAFHQSISSLPYFPMPAHLAPGAGVFGLEESSPSMTWPNHILQPQPFEPCKISIGSAQFPPAATQEYIPTAIQELPSAAPVQHADFPLPLVGLMDSFQLPSDDFWVNQEPAVVGDFEHFAATMAFNSSSSTDGSFLAELAMPIVPEMFTMNMNVDGNQNPETWESFVASLELDLGH